MSVASPRSGGPSTGPRRWARVKEVLHGALELPRDERGPWLDGACAGDDALRAEVTSLLAAHDEDASFLEVPAFADRADALEAERSADVAGRRVGPFRLVRELGRGGMGTVYLAVRDDGQYEREVALKVISRGMDTDLVVRRFRRERQILAELSHPDIARLYSGGTTDDGRPYFAMEYVDGVPIDEYCVRHSLGIAERLALFRRVCDAVQYAHQRLVVHRDLKPANILVCAGGAPKLLDFGIARVLDPAEGRAAQTRGTLVALTPEYASPEQLAGERETTLSDVYSLGVLLYELLTGRHPSDTARTDGRTTLATTEVERPSVAAQRRPTAGAPEGGGARLARRLRGDLDNIVSMAMRREPSRRYASAEQLADDVRRHLESLPVHARADTVGYRTAQFIRRHRAGAVAAAAAAVALVVGVAAVAWQAHVARLAQARADRRFADVRELATSFVFELDRAIAPLAGSTSARELLVERSLTTLDRLSREARGDAALLRDLASAYVRVGEVQGAPYAANLGHTAAALTSYRKAVTILDRLAAERPAGDSLQRQLQRERVRAYTATSAVQARAGDVDGAIATQRRAVAIAEDLVARAGSTRADQQLLADAQLFFGRAVFQKSSAAASMEALAAYERSHALWARLAAASPEDATARWRAATTDAYIAYPHWRLGELTGDTTHLRLALDHLERFHRVSVAQVATHPADAIARRSALDGLHEMAQLRVSLGDTRGALRELAEARPAALALAAADPRNAEAQRDVAVIEVVRLSAYAMAGDAPHALAAGARARAILTQLLAMDGTSNDDLENLAVVERTLGDVYRARGDERAALARYAASRDAARRWAAMTPGSSGPHRAVALAASASGALHLTRAARAPGEHTPGCTEIAEAGREWSRAAASPLAHADSVQAARVDSVRAAACVPNG